MIGYHYTSRENWYRIRKEGLKPYLIRNHPELDEYFPDGVEGIWIWDKPHRGKMELASILWQVAMKQTVHVVKLKVDYLETDILFYKGGDILLHHHGYFGDFVGHDGRQTARIVVIPIPCEKIELIREYNLLDLVKNGNT